MDESLKELGSYIEQALGPARVSVEIVHGELNLTVPAADVLSVLRFLRDDSQCRFFSFVDLCGVDYPARQRRFDVVTHLLSPTLNLRLRVKVETDEVTPVPSITPIFPGADWFEREAYDLYGILFTGHPELRRLLTDYGFEGHPLRKDFPTTGFVEVRYETRPSGWSTSRSGSTRNSATSTSCRLGKAPITCCPATRRRTEQDPAANALKGRRGGTSNERLVKALDSEPRPVGTKTTSAARQEAQDG
ncbi:NADH-quinone oxidoreductase subunit C 1 [Methylobrevis pamukkalensis]|uniref:NADH-quinone oxidoreductase subunit C n=1 Tax=Methylobrevis pamukkalensis TaxID=1439726 RepID=A0A1E3H9K0_9HYPH|nr:NADH-quinone oxidoreductase subunit C 1 [Methylobrevis pamukkalensis]